MGDVVERPELPCGDAKSAAPDVNTSLEEARPAWTGLYDDDGRKRASDEHAYPDPRPCTLDDAGVEIKTGPDSDEAEDVRSYFARFVAPIRQRDGAACVHCGERYSWVWGIVHGEGQCTTCGWPVRVYHFIKDRHGSDLVTIRGLPLQYPPANAPAWRSPPDQSVGRESDDAAPERTTGPGSTTS